MEERKGLQDSTCGDVHLFVDVLVFWTTFRGCGDQQDSPWQSRQLREQCVHQDCL